MMNMLLRKFSKGIHSVASAGLIGGLACYMLLLVVNVPADAAAYAQMRSTILVISYWVIVPSLIVCIVTGLFSMLVHHPFQDKGWVWIKAALGFLLFKGVLATVYEKAALGAEYSQDIITGEATVDMLERAVAYEWSTLIVLMLVAVANIYFGIWRPRRIIWQGSVKAEDVEMAKTQAAE